MAIKVENGGEIEVSPEAEKIYHEAIARKQWITYRKQWYIPLEFVINLSRVDLSEVRIENPILAINKGQEIIERMIMEDYPKESIIAAFRRLNALTRKVYGHRSSLL